MTNRVYIRVTLHGNEARRELMLDGRKVGNIDVSEVKDLAIELLRKADEYEQSPVSFFIDGEEVILPYAEAINTIMQVSSSLRW